jgi:putative membrane protein
MKTIAFMVALMKKRIITLTLIVVTMAFVIMVFLLPFSVTVYADGKDGDEGWHMMEGWNMMGGGFFMWLFWILVIGVVVYLLVNFSKRQGPETKETPLDILKKRYAQGDISKEEYEQMKRDLQQ